MKALLGLLFLWLLSALLHANIDQYTFCESCLAAAQEIEKVLKESSKTARLGVVEGLLSRKLCENISSHEQIPSGRMRSACRHLLALHHEEFKAALLNEDPTKLPIVLCYELSKACMGVKRRSFTDDKGSFTERDIEVLLRDNKDNVRLSQPTRHTQDEL